MGKIIYGYYDKLWEPIHEFKYTGHEEEFTLEPGKYLLICNGAKGGGCSSTFWCYGGSAYGVLDIDTTETFYACVGGNGETYDGDNSRIYKGGWNGGGNGHLGQTTTYRSGSGGGGATDIRLMSPSAEEEEVSYAAGDGFTLPDMNLPSGYKQLRYLRSENFGNSVPLDYIPKANTTVEWIGVSTPNTSPGHNQCEMLFGCRSNNDIKEFGFYVSSYSSSSNNFSKTAVMCINDRKVYTGREFTYDQTVRLVMGNGNKCEWFIGENLDEKVHEYTAATNFVDCEYVICLYSQNNGRNYPYTPYDSLNSISTIYSFKIWEDDELVRQYVPCIRTSDNKYGMYEVLTNTFLSAQTYNSSGWKYSDVIPYMIHPSLLTRIIVAGGAGAATTHYASNNVSYTNSNYGGGVVGGFIGGQSSDSNKNKYATQTSGYKFGTGESATQRTFYGNYSAEGCGGAGGGWFGGYASAHNSSSYSSVGGSGGSGYVLTESSYKPKGYNVDPKFYLTDTFMNCGCSEESSIIICKETQVCFSEDTIRFICNGREERITLPKGEYILKCWGGEGGNRVNQQTRAYGGYAEGKLSLDTPTNLFVNVGGSGHRWMFHNTSPFPIDIANPTVAYNGGGKGTNSSPVGMPGGGGTDFRLFKTQSVEELQQEFAQKIIDNCEELSDGIYRINHIETKKIDSYIILDVFPDITTNIEFTASQVVRSDDMCFIGSRLNSNGNQYCVWMHTETSTTFYCCLVYGSDVWNSGYKTSFQTNVSPDQKAKYYISPTEGVFVDDVFINKIEPAGTPQAYRLQLFGLSRGEDGEAAANDRRQWYGKLFDLKIYQNDELIVDMVPAINVYTQKAGLYDRVTNEFKTSLGNDFAYGIFNDADDDSFPEYYTDGTTEVIIPEGELTQLDALNDLSWENGEYTSADPSAGYIGWNQTLHSLRDQSILVENTGRCIKITSLKSTDGNPMYVRLDYNIDENGYRRGGSAYVQEGATVLIPDDVYNFSFALKYKTPDNNNNCPISIVASLIVEFQQSAQVVFVNKSLMSRIIVAGGGGGSAAYNDAGSGGGLTGVKPQTHHGTTPGAGTQTSSPQNSTYPQICGGFGYGGNGAYANNGAGGAGGGGWYGGSGSYPDSSADNNNSGCGGSGYVLTESSIKPAGYQVGEEYYLTDTVLTTGGNTLPVPGTSKAEIYVIEASYIKILIHDDEGYKYFNKDTSSWELFTQQITAEDFEAYGTSNIKSLDGLLDEFQIIIHDIYDSMSGIKIDYIPKPEYISQLVPKDMEIKRAFIDAEYDDTSYKLSMHVQKYDEYFNEVRIIIDKIKETIKPLRIYVIQLYSK